MAVHKSLLERIPTHASTFPVSVPGNVDVSYGSTEGPFVIVDAFGTTDRFYVNHVTGGQIAEAFGWTSPDATEKLHGEIEHLRSEIVRLHDEVAEAKANQVVPLAEVIDFAKAREQRRPAPAA